MLAHLIELRRRLLFITLFFLIIISSFFFFSNELFELLMKPLIKALPKQSTLIATHLTSPLLTPLKLTIDIALICTTPFALLQLWYFIAPALYKQERYRFAHTVICSFLLFCLGILFCFYLVLPCIFYSFAQTTPAHVHYMPDIVFALEFITRMLLLFGIGFQVPLIVFVLVKLQYIDLISLKKIRPYIIVSSFTLGMLLTPPDVFSQIMLAVPLCLLYELGMVLIIIFGRKNTP